MAFQIGHSDTSPYLDPAMKDGQCFITNVSKSDLENGKLPKSTREFADSWGYDTSTLQILPTLLKRGGISDTLVSVVGKKRII